MGAQPAVARSVAALREQGVLVLDGPDGYMSHPPKQSGPKAFLWEKAFAGIRRRTGVRAGSLLVETVVEMGGRLVVAIPAKDYR